MAMVPSVFSTAPAEVLGIGELSCLPVASSRALLSPVAQALASHSDALEGLPHEVYRLLHELVGSAQCFPHLVVIVKGFQLTFPPLLSAALGKGDSLGSPIPVFLLLYTDGSPWLCRIAEDDSILRPHAGDFFRLSLNGDFLSAFRFLMIAVLVGHSLHSPHGRAGASLD